MTTESEDAAMRQMHRFSDEQVAQIAHEATRALQDVLGDPAPSQPWLAEDDETRQSAIDGVRNARAGATPESSHQNWCAFKEAHGWVWGPEKDWAKKTHPCLVPYRELPEDQKVKDKLFLHIVTALTVG